MKAANISFSAVNKKEMQAKIQAVADKIAREFKPEKIILFGSYAWGNPGPDSDVDLLVVHKTALPKRERALIIKEKLMLYGMGIPMDLLVYTPSEIDEKINQDRNLFIEDVVNNGRVLYAHN